MNKKVRNIILIIVSVLVIEALIFGGKKIFLDKSESIEFDKVLSSSTKETVVDFEIEKSGKYYVDYSWKSDQIPGMISGLVIYDPNGNIVEACTGCLLSISGSEKQFEKGIYKIHIFGISNDEEYKAFVDEYIGESNTGKEAFEFEEGEWNVHYEFSAEKTTNLIATAVFSGTVAGLGIAAIVLVLVRNKKQDKRKYDERQKLKKGKGSEIAFITMLVMLGIFGVAYEAQIPIPFTNGLICWMVLLIGVTVYASYAVWNECYFALNVSKNGMRIGLGFFFVLNTAMAILTLAMGESIIESGGLIGTKVIINLFCGAVSLFIVAESFLKDYIDKKDEKGEDDEES